MPRRVLVQRSDDSFGLDPRLPAGSDEAGRIYVRAGRGSGRKARPRRVTGDAGRRRSGNPVTRFLWPWPSAAREANSDRGDPR